MTFRKRLRETTPSGVVTHAVAAVVGLVLVWYGLMIILLAAKVSPDTVETLSGYRTIYDFFAGLDAGDITGTVRLVTGLGGLALFVVFAWLVWRRTVEPAAGRPRVALRGDATGTVEARPRAIERAVEVAALEHTSITEARARYDGESIALDVETRHARDLPETLREARRRAIESLRLHDFPSMPVNVTLTGFQRKNRRELA